eukprot:scaffold60308_cov56-Phaeocystis_antarctica.AAC.5
MPSRIPCTLMTCSSWSYQKRTPWRCHSSIFSSLHWSPPVPCAWERKASLDCCRRALRSLRFCRLERTGVSSPTATPKSNRLGARAALEIDEDGGAREEEHERDREVDLDFVDVDGAEPVQQAHALKAGGERGERVGGVWPHARDEELPRAEDEDEHHAPRRRLRALRLDNRPVKGKGQYAEAARERIPPRQPCRAVELGYLGVRQPYLEAEEEDAVTVPVGRVPISDGSCALLVLTWPRDDVGDDPRLYLAQGDELQHGDAHREEDQEEEAAGPAIIVALLDEGLEEADGGGGEWHVEERKDHH